MKLFSTKFHGFLDYGTVVNLPVLFRLLRAQKPTQQVADAGALAVVLYSLLTRYEMGLLKVLPMPAHLALDLLLGATLCGTALRQTEETTAVRGTLAGLGLFSMIAPLLTETTPKSPHP